MASSVKCGFAGVSVCVVSLALVYASDCAFAISFMCPRPHHHMRGCTHRINIVHAIPSQYPTSLSTQNPKNMKPLYLKQVQRVLTSDVYNKNYLLTSSLVVAYKISNFWKCHNLVETCGTSDSEGALSSNTSRY